MLNGKYYVFRDRFSGSICLRSESRIAKFADTNDGRAAFAAVVHMIACNNGTLFDKDSGQYLVGSKADN